MRVQMRINHIFYITMTNVNDNILYRIYLYINWN